jgi:hypothetical protein
MQLAVINRNNHSLHTCSYKYDAFGNALGNSVVRAANAGPSAKQIAAVQAQSDAIGQIGQNAVNPGTDATVAKIGQQTATDLSAQVGRVSWALNHNAMIEANSDFAALEAVNFGSGVSLPRVGVNTKLQFTPINILGFSLTPAIVAEGRY